MLKNKRAIRKKLKSKEIKDKELLQDSTETLSSWDRSSREVHVDDYLQGNEGQYANIAALSRLKNTDPLEWTVQDVANWLDYIHLSEYRPEFMRQMVSGQELQELDQDDLVISLGVRKVFREILCSFIQILKISVKIGHQKRLERRIKMLKHGLAGALDEVSDNRSESDTSSQATSYSSSASGVSVSSQVLM